MADFDPSTPSIARVYDYFLGGRDNFAADRELAQRLIDVFPPIPATVRENKQFLHRAVTWVAGEGIAQFIDIGCGLPTTPSTHGSARVVSPGTRVAYIDSPRPPKARRRNDRGRSADQLTPHRYRFNGSHRAAGA